METNWEAISAIATAAAAIAAAVSAIFSYLTIRDMRAATAAQRAGEYIRTYLTLAIQHPQLSTEGSAKEKEQQRYEWFVSYVLMMVREVLGAYRGNDGWRRLMRDQVFFNREELERWPSSDIEKFGPEVADFVHSVLKEKKK
jgi:hypothetical protein